MSKITIESEDSSMDRIVIHTSPQGNLVIKIEQIVAGEGVGDAIYKETIKTCGVITLNVDDVHILEDYVEQYVYRQQETKRVQELLEDRTRL
jgi:hypothetical protein